MEKRRITKFIKNEVGSDRVPEDGGSWKIIGFVIQLLYRSF